jgi:hypothetical protein
MKKLLIAIALACCMLARPASAQVQPVAATLIAASTGVCLPTNCLPFSVPSGVGSATFQIGGNTTFSGTVQFEVVLFDGSYYPLNATPSNSGTQVTSATGPGSWQVNIAGFTTVRMRATTLASGSVAAFINPSTASARSGGSGGGGSGTVTSVSGTANQIDVATGTTTPVVSVDSALQLPGTLSMAQAGASSAAAFTMSGLPFAGNGTTSTPLFYQNGGTAPTTWSTGGTYFGVNAASGFAGNLIDFHINGGNTLMNLSSNGTLTVATAITSQGGINAAAGGRIQWTGFGGITGPSNGVFYFHNTAVTGLTRVSLGPDTATTAPAFCPTVTTTPVLNIDVSGACTTPSFVKTAQSLAVTGSDFTCSSGCTSLTTITGLSATLPTVAANWSFSCDLIIDQATAAAADQIGVQTATNASTNLAATAIAYTAAAVSTSGSLVGASSTTSQSVLTFTPGATGTNLPLHLAGTVEGASASGTVLNIQILTGSSSDAITVKRGSACWVY